LYKDQSTEFFILKNPTRRSYVQLPESTLKFYKNNYKLTQILPAKILQLNPNQPVGVPARPVTPLLVPPAHQPVPSNLSAPPPALDTVHGAVNVNTQSGPSDVALLVG
jgi:hypothetical protein